MAVCHSVTCVNGELMGDPLEVKMLEATGWDFHEMFEANMDELVLAYAFPKNNNSEIEGANYKIAIMRRFDFSSKLQRMSVIVKNLLDN
mmetsp:Transcript_30136/g.22398  ORF Transcript_30136/g.22398 Transcript_30136/m.22398 type:complete len:89 (-) Transcript_30136:762-1028(-)